MTVSIVQDFIPVTLPTRPQTLLIPESITIHNTDNTTKGAGAAAHNKYVRGADAVKRQVSWHYTVDDGIAYQHLPTNEVGWHANRAGNAKSLGIEICMNSDLDVRAAYDNAANLVAYLVKVLDLDFPACMKQHNDWSGKNCPSVIRAGTAMTWAKFLNLCEAQVDASKSLKDAPQAQILGSDAAADWAPDDETTILVSIDVAIGLHHGEED